MPAGPGCGLWVCVAEKGVRGWGSSGMQGMGVLAASQDVPLRVSGTQEKRLLSFVQHLSGLCGEQWVSQPGCKLRPGCRSSALAFKWQRRAGF